MSSGENPNIYLERPRAMGWVYLVYLLKRKKKKVFYPEMKRKVFYYQIELKLELEKKRRHFNWMLQSSSRCYNSTVTHSTSLWLLFLVSDQQRRALEHTFIALNSISTQHCHTHQKYTGSLQKYGCLYIPDTQWWSHGVGKRNLKSEDFLPTICLRANVKTMFKNNWNIQLKHWQKVNQFVLVAENLSIYDTEETPPWHFHDNPEKHQVLYCKWWI